jgi:hypothetical protein
MPAPLLVSPGAPAAQAAEEACPDLRQGQAIKGPSCGFTILLNDTCAWPPCCMQTTVDSAATHAVEAWTQGGSADNTTANTTSAQGMAAEQRLVYEVSVVTTAT